MPQLTQERSPSSSKHILTSILTPLNTIPALPQVSDTQLPSNTPAVSFLATQPHDSQSHQKAKSVLLTLHFLFPHELLPALDIIDRKLISHLYIDAHQPGPDVSISHSPATASAQTTPLPPTSMTSNVKNEVYYVQSASASTSTSHGRGGRFRNALNRKEGQRYEVRLEGWNCSCAAFAYSEIRLMMRGAGMGIRVGVDTSSKEGELGGRYQSNANVGIDTQVDAHEQERSELEWAMGGIATRPDAVMPICKHILAVALVKAAPGLFASGCVSTEVGKDEMAGWAAGWGER